VVPNVPRDHAVRPSGRYVVVVWLWATVLRVTILDNIGISVSKAVGVAPHEQLIVDTIQPRVVGLLANENSSDCGVQLRELL
jgi:hypothetical protein